MQSGLLASGDWCGSAVPPRGRPSPLNPSSPLKPPSPIPHPAVCDSGKTMREKNDFFYRRGVITLFAKKDLDHDIVLKSTFLVLYRQNFLLTLFY